MWRGGRDVSRKHFLSVHVIVPALDPTPSLLSGLCRHHVTGAVALQHLKSFISLNRSFPATGRPLVVSPASHTTLISPIYL